MKIALQQHTSLLSYLDSSLFQHMKRERVEVGQTAGWLADLNGWACFLLLYYTLDLSVLCLNEDQHDHLELCFFPYFPSRSLLYSCLSIAHE